MSWTSKYVLGKLTRWTHLLPVFSLVWILLWLHCCKKRDQLAQIMGAFVLGMIEYSIFTVPAITYLSTILCLELQTQFRGNVNPILSNCCEFYLQMFTEVRFKHALLYYQEWSSHFLSILRVTTVECCHFGPAHGAGSLGLTHTKYLAVVWPAKAVKHVTTWHNPNQLKLNDTFSIQPIIFIFGHALQCH